MAYTTPYVSSPFRERDPYKQDAGRMSDLIRMRSAAEARGIEDQGNASAQMWSGIGNAVSGTLSQLAQYKADTPKREAAQLEMNEKQRVVREQANLRGLDQMAGAGKMDAEGRASLYEGEGFQKEAAGIRSEDTRQKIGQLDLVGKELEAQKQRRGQVAGMLRSYDSLSEEAKAAAYQRDLLEIRKLVPEFANKIPNVYDAASVRQMIDYGTTLQEQAQIQQMATAKAQEALAMDRNSREARVAHQDALMMGLRAAATKEQWDATWATADQLGVPKGAMSMFSREFSPEAMKHARNIFESMDEKNPTALSGALAAFRRDHDGNLPNERQYLKLLDDVGNAQVNYRPTASGGLNVAQRNQAIRTRDIALMRVDTLLRNNEIDGATADAMRVDARASFNESTNYTEVEPPLDVQRGPVIGPDKDRPDAPLSNLAGPAQQPPPSARTMPPPQQFRVNLPNGQTLILPSKEAADAAMAEIAAMTQQQGPPAPTAPPVAAPVAAPRAVEPPRPMAGVVIDDAGRPATPATTKAPVSRRTLYEAIDGFPKASKDVQDRFQTYVQRTLTAPTKQELTSAWARFKRDIQK